jgi:hypothetical protein
MSKQILSGIPTFTGEVMKVELNPGVTPSFDREFSVKVRKKKAFLAPAIKPNNPIIIKLEASAPTFDEQFAVTIQKINGGN